MMNRLICFDHNESSGPGRPPILGSWLEWSSGLVGAYLKAMLLT